MNGFGHLQERLMAREKLFSLASTIPFLSGNGHIVQYLSVQKMDGELGVPSAVGFLHCAGSGEGLFLSPKPYPHKCVEAGARTRDLPVTYGRLYRCTRPALQKMDGEQKAQKLYNISLTERNKIV